MQPGASAIKCVTSKEYHTVINLWSHDAVGELMHFYFFEFHRFESSSDAAADPNEIYRKNWFRLISESVTARHFVSGVCLALPEDSREQKMFLASVEELLRIAARRFRILYDKIYTKKSGGPLIPLTERRKKRKQFMEEIEQNCAILPEQMNKKAGKNERKMSINSSYESNKNVLIIQLKEAMAVINQTNKSLSPVERREVLERARQLIVQLFNCFEDVRCKSIAYT